MSDFIMLKNVRVSFPALFERPIINGEPGKCGATLMLDRKSDTDQIKNLKAAIVEMCKEKFKGRMLPPEKICLRTGEDKGRDEYNGYDVLTASNKDKPAVISNDGRSIVTDSQQSSIYSGCYVNAKVRLWAQNNKFGKRINCELIAIQFAGEGESLDNSKVTAKTAMDGFGVQNETDEEFAAA